MDYTSKNLLFKLMKFLRYVRLYGVSRTLVKVRGQYHMKKRYKTLPKLADPIKKGGHVGLLGCGNFMFSNIAYYLKKNYGAVVRGVMDVDIHKSVSVYERYGARYYTDDAKKIIEDSEIDLVYIASNHASHAEYAIQALRAGKNVHIEKPHVVRMDQLERLCSAMSECKGKVNLGFNRPYSSIGRAIKVHLDSQDGPAIYNWFIAGHEISPEHWYFNDSEGGRVLGNLCHWSDFVFQLVAPENRYPLTINPTRGTRKDCDIAVTYTFGDESIAALTFSAKGHTFEGVRERFSAHRGNVLISMEDFKNLSVEIVEKKHKINKIFRDHGHELSIKRSYEMDLKDGSNVPRACSIDYVWETGNLFLKTREALESDRKITLQAYSGYASAISQSKPIA